MISLCAHCNLRFGNRFPEGSPCRICGGLLDSLPSLLSGAKAAMKPEWKAFALSTAIPREISSREEDAWDYSEGESLKSWLNAYLSKELEKATGKTYSPIYADGRILIHLESMGAEGENEPLFLFGRYKKLVTGICQSKWVCLTCHGRGCKKCGGTGKIYQESIEEILGDAAVSETGGTYTLHASGREDVDVLNFAGRPFILEVKNPTFFPPNLEKITEKINSSKKVETTPLLRAPPGSVKLVSDSHFPKTYRAWIDSDSPLTQEDAQKLLTFDFTLEQRTPERVAHRRADLVRKRRARVVSATLQEREDSAGEGGADAAEEGGAGSATVSPPRNMIIADIHADAGTYIKELIHSDKGRTTPSISSFLGKECTCTRLDVIKIEDDFLDLSLH